MTNDLVLLFHALLPHMPYVYLAMVVLSSMFSAFYYLRAKSAFSQWQPDSDEPTLQIEKDVDCVWISSSICSILSFLFLALPFCFADQLQFRGSVLIVAVFLIGGVIITFLQKKALQITLLLYPEKRTSFFRGDCQKDLYDQADEAERELIGEASYRAYKTTQNVCLLLIVWLALSNLVADIGFLPILCAAMIWLTSSVSYFSCCYQRSYL